MKGVCPVTARRKSFYGKTEQEAIFKATYVEGQTLTKFYELVYLPTVQHLSVNYNQLIGYMFDCYVAPKLGATPLDQIDRSMLQRFFNGLTNQKGTKPLAPRTLKNIHNLVYGILDLAETDGAIEKNHAGDVRLPRPAPPRHKSIGATNLKTLIDNAEGELLEFIKLTGGAGLRTGEALGAGSKFLAKDILSIEQQIQRTKGGGVRIQDSLKTEAGRREVPLPFEMPQAVYFCSLKPQQAQYRLRVLGEKLGMGAVYPHALRHTFITIMEDELECPRRIVQELVGHKRGAITDGYSKVSMEAKRRWMEKYWKHVKEASVVNLRQNEAS